MAETLAQTRHRRSERGSHWLELIRKEDWWAIWIGLGLVAVAVGVFAAGASQVARSRAAKVEPLSDVADQLLSTAYNMRRCSCCGRCCSELQPPRSESAVADSWRRFSPSTQRRR